jgi:catechol 2,3-dioxygenase-like lactoylglutathione lyase family enzyme
LAHTSLKACLLLGLAAFFPAAALAGEAQSPAAPPQIQVSLMGPGFRTGDLDQALRFWREGLAMVELTRLNFGDTVEVILGFGANPKPPMVMLLARSDGTGEEIAVNATDKLVLAVSDAGAARARLEAAGFAPTEIHLHEASGTRVFFVTDPDGRRLEITQPPPMAQ